MHVRAIARGSGYTCSLGPLDNHRSARADAGGSFRAFMIPTNPIPHAHACVRPQEVLYGAMQDSGPKAQRVRPEELPAAGGRPHSAHVGAAPFATHYPGGEGRAMLHVGVAHCDTDIAMFTASWVHSPPPRQHAALSPAHQGPPGLCIRPL